MTLSSLLSLQVHLQLLHQLYQLFLLRASDYSYRPWEYTLLRSDGTASKWFLEDAGRYPTFRIPFLAVTLWCLHSCRGPWTGVSSSILLGSSGWTKTGCLAWYFREQRKSVILLLQKTFSRCKWRSYGSLHKWPCSQVAWIFSREGRSSCPLACAPACVAGDRRASKF